MSEKQDTPKGAYGMEVLQDLCDTVRATLLEPQSQGMSTTSLAYSASRRARTLMCRVANAAQTHSAYDQERMTLRNEMDQVPTSRYDVVRVQSRDRLRDASPRATESP
jgi:hypothetical protein